MARTDTLTHTDCLDYGKSECNGPVEYRMALSVLMDALGNQGVRRLRQVMSDRETREDLVQLAHRMFEVYPSGLCPTIAHDIMEINIEYYQEKKGSQR
jgi:hypothetical protein